MLSKAGLRKLTIMGRKVKVEFLLQDLAAAGGKGSCRLCYLLGGQEKEKSWDIVFVSGGRQMQFLQKLEEAEEMEGIVDCRIFLPGGKEIRGEADAVTEEKQNVEAADARMQIPDIDKFLKIARVIKRRTVANEAADSGRVFVNGKQVKPSYEVKLGDIVEIKFGDKVSKFEIIKIPKIQGKDMGELIKVL